MSETAPVNVDMKVLKRALAAVTPRLDFAEWGGPLEAAFAKFEFDTARRVAAGMGQFLVEAGPELQWTVENLNYASATRLVAVYPSEITSPADAVAYVMQPERLANHVYAGRSGNGDEASGDGWRFRGRGLIQVTGRAAYTALAAELGMGLEAVVDYCETPAGAAMSGCWWLARHGFLQLADGWDIPAITRMVNGPGMEEEGLRLTYSEYLKGVLGAKA